ncbi:claudin-34-like [Carettochelys insculpta]|uniref:claudin-34-like n=1 Tax=Carettochelys insculpta TaxID=44489 RepID=UPI003EB9A7DE
MTVGNKKIFVLKDVLTKEFATIRKWKTYQVTSEYEGVECRIQETTFQSMLYLTDGLSVLGWILCTISIGLIQWRVWHVDNTSLISSGIVWIGIWDVCFTVNPELANDSSLILCQGFTNENTSIPLEIFAAQDLLMLATVMEAIAIGFVLFALWSAYKKEVKKKYILFFFLTGGVLNIMSSVFIFIPVIWNLYSTMKNHSIVFPPSYYVPSTPKSQKVGAAIPVGLVAALLLLLSGILLLYDWFPKLPCKVHPKKEEPDHIAQNHKQTCPSTHLSARSGHTYPHCGSFLEIELWGPQRPFGSGSSGLVRYSLQMDNFLHHECQLTK